VKFFAAALLLWPAFAWAAGEVRGRFGAPDISPIPNVTARLISVGPAAEVRAAPVGSDGTFYFPDVNAGSYILEGKIGETRFFFQAVRVAADERVDVGTFLQQSLTCDPPACFADDFGFRPPPTPPQILDVCSALKENQKILAKKIVIVGYLEETRAGPVLVGHCRDQLVSGGYSWMNAIGLPGFTRVGLLNLSQVPDWNRVREPDKQLSRLAAAAKKHDHRPGNRVVAVYGRLSPQISLEQQKCREPTCQCDIQYPPADLVEIKGGREME